MLIVFQQVDDSNGTHSVFEMMNSGYKKYIKEYCKILRKNNSPYCVVQLTDNKLVRVNHDVSLTGKKLSKWFMGFIKKINDDIK